MSAPWTIIRSPSSQNKLSTVYLSLSQKITTKLRITVHLDIWGSRWQKWKRLIFLQIVNLDSFKCWDKSRATNSSAVGAVGAVRWETLRRCFWGVVFVLSTFDAWPMRQPWHRAPFLHPQPYHHPLTLPPMIFLSHFYRTRVRSALPGLVSN